MSRLVLAILALALLLGGVAALLGGSLAQPTMDPEDDGLQVAIGPAFEPSGVRLAIGPAFEPNGLRLG